MELEKIIELIHTVSESNLTQFTMEEGNLKISMKTDKQTKVIPAPVLPSQGEVAAAPIPAAAAVIPSVQAEAVQSAEKEEALTGNLVKSPLVGTFYNAPSPDAEPFVKVGDTVKKGQVLGIVEAMKLMNEIESEFEGTVEKILASNEEVVEYGQPLFVIK